MPNTVNRFFSVPNTGDLPGAWGTSALNPNFQSIDGALGGITTISLSAATTFTLTLPAGASFTPGAGPSQSENALIKFSGTLTGNAVVKFTMPGYYIIHNNCASAASFSIQLSPAVGVGNSIGAPPGRKCHVFFDGTDMDYVDMPEVGSALDLHTNSTGMPLWMSVCTVKPYLIKDGSVYNNASYTALAQVLGSTFGGNGITTFGLPDERARARIALDTLSVNTGTFAGRITFAGSGIIATTMAAAGGSEFLTSHTHTGTTNATTATFPYVQGSPNMQTGSNSNVINAINSAGQTASVDSHVHTFTTQATGAGSSGNVMPVVVSFLPLIKT